MPWLFVISLLGGKITKRTKAIALVNIIFVTLKFLAIANLGTKKSPVLRGFFP